MVYEAPSDFAVFGFFLGWVEERLTLVGCEPDLAWPDRDLIDTYPSRQMVQSESQNRLPRAHTWTQITLLLQIFIAITDFFVLICILMRNTEC